MIELTQLWYRYPDHTPALRGINLTVAAGEKVALLGVNGAGKSTLLLHLNGTLHPERGTVVVNGTPVTKQTVRQVRAMVGLVFQNPDDQLFAPTVEQDVAFGPMNLGLSKEEIEKRVKDSLKAVSMEGFERKPPHHLSGGQKKRIAIAGILAMNPEIIVLDEPTSGLDPMGASQIMKLLYELNRQGITIIISTHDVDLVPIYANKVYLLNEGKIIKGGTPREIFSDSETVRSANLRLPRVAHLIELLEKEDKLGIKMGYTIGEARNNIKEFIKGE